MNKKLETIAICAGIAYIAYGLYNGSLTINWVAVILLVLCVLLRLRDMRKIANLEREQHNAGELIHGYVRAPIILRALLLLVLLVSWGAVIVIPIVTLGSLMPPAWMYLLVIGETLVFRYGLGFAWNVIIYSKHEVIRKNGLRKKVYAWSEFGEVKQFFERKTFCDKNGRKIFTISSAYDGFEGFYNVYRSKHPEQHYV